MNSIYYDKDIFIIPESSSTELEFPASVDMVVVCYEEDYEPNKDLLHNILKAISRVENVDFSIYKLRSEESLNLAKSLNEQIKTVLCFGVQPKKICMNAGFRANALYKTESFSLMLSHSLNQLQSDAKYKKALWEALKREFISH